MKSILPQELDSKRVRIAKIHNLLMIGLLTGLFGGIVLVLEFLHAYHKRFNPLVALVIMAVIEGYGIWEIFRYDNRLCRQFGYMCPHCQNPLYEPRAKTYLTGICPKCGRKVF